MNPFQSLRIRQIELFWFVSGNFFKFFVSKILIYKVVTFRAFDLGTPSLSGVSSVLIHVIDMNDNPPEFLESSYEVSIPEDIEAGSPILSVKARDADGSSPNNEIVYRYINYFKFM